MKELIEKAREFMIRRNFKRYGVQNEHGHLTLKEMATFAAEQVRAERQRIAGELDEYFNTPDSAIQDIDVYIAELKGGGE